MSKLDIPQINLVKFNLLDDDTRELMKEFKAGLFSKCPTYNGSMMLFRTILTHFAADLNGGMNPQTFNKAIDMIDEKVDFTYDYYNELFKLKKISNEIVHDFKVLKHGDEAILNDAWEFIKWMVEDII